MNLKKKKKEKKLRLHLVENGLYKFEKLLNFRRENHQR